MEGGLGAPERHPLDWQSDDFYNKEAIDEELRRVFDICHGCRLCFNLCDSFPRLFDLIDESESGELDTVDSVDFKPVVDACTLCDMCFMSTCPYTPPHEFQLDFPHLMLRYRATEHRDGKTPFWDRQMTKTDRNGKLAGLTSGIANWATDRGNRITRPILEDIADVDRNAELPKFHAKSFTAHAAHPPARDTSAPAAARKAVLYATCFVNYNNPNIGIATQAILAANGVETEVVYPECCGMPQLEQGDLDDVARRAKNVALAMKPWIEDGYDVIGLVPSCALMLKFEWPLLLPDDPDVARLSKATKDVAEYVVDIARNEGLVAEPKPLEGGVSLHLACHARAQNMGQKAADMLRLIPGMDLKIIERCSGHGGSWGIKKDNFETALKVGKNAARAAGREDKAHVASECPLAGVHMLQGMERLNQENPDTFKAPPSVTSHPVELFARACGLL